MAAPVLTFRYYGPVEGRIVDIDRSFSDQLRLTLDRVVLEDVPPERTPERVRVALHGDQGFTDPQPGLTVILSGHLSPPDGPVEPGGFDFQRLAWFSQLGAVGYTRAPVLAIAPPEGGLPLMAFRMRRAIVHGDAGADGGAARCLRGRADDRRPLGRVAGDEQRAQRARTCRISSRSRACIWGF